LRAGSFRVNIFRTGSMPPRFLLLPSIESGTPTGSTPNVRKLHAAIYASFSFPRRIPSMLFLYRSINRRRPDPREPPRPVSVPAAGSVPSSLLYCPEKSIDNKKILPDTVRAFLDTKKKARKALFYFRSTPDPGLLRSDPVRFLSFFNNLYPFFPSPLPEYRRLRTSPRRLPLPLLFPA